MMPAPQKNTTPMHVAEEKSVRPTDGERARCTGTTDKDLGVTGDLELRTRKQQKAQASRLGLKLQKRGLFR